MSRILLYYNILHEKRKTPKTLQPSVLFPKMHTQQTTTNSISFGIDEENTSNNNIMMCDTVLCYYYYIMCVHCTSDE